MAKKVLIVEDNKEMRYLERDILEAEGYTVLEAAKAQEGVDIAVKEVPDIIIMDIRLPSKKRGIGAAHILRKDKRTENIPIIFVTAYDKAEDAKEVANISNTSFLAKPFEIEEFLKQIKKHTTEQES